LLALAFVKPSNTKVIQYDRLARELIAIGFLNEFIVHFF